MLHVGVCCNVVSDLCSLVVTCWERADLLAIVCVLCFVTFPVVSWFALKLGVGWRREAGLSPQVKYFTDHSKVDLLLWIFYVFSVLCLLCLCKRLFICALWSPAGKELISWLSFVVFYVDFPLLSWFKFGT